MIIDVHYHITPQVSAQGLDRMLDHLEHIAGRTGRKLDRATVSARILAERADPDGEKLIAYMDEAGVDITCACLVDNMERKAVTPQVVRQVNAWLGQVANKHAGRIIPLAGVDPRRKEAAEIARECFEVHGAAGVKYHPDHGYWPAGKESYKVLEVVAEHKGVLLSHTGALAPPHRPKYAEPILLSDIAVDFPEIRVIAAHAGMSNYLGWANLASQQPNLYGDLAMWDVMAISRPSMFRKSLRQAMDWAGDGKLVFGSDGPIFYDVINLKEWLDVIKALPGNHEDGVNFTAREVEDILGGTARKVFEI